ncbi:hypothetical protein [Kerstersia similis]|uniref:hypothetical protein n=1 Tax=Kerstersia similis TaxID=206505 RepID=UPI0039EE6172
MDIEKYFSMAAHEADAAVQAVMKKYKDGYVTDEDDMTGILLGRLDAAFSGRIGGIEWSSSVLRHRKGIASQEGKSGADILIHVSLDSFGVKYSKGVLVQAKRISESATMTMRQHSELVSQCQKMLKISPSSFVFNYDVNSMRCASANRVGGDSNRNLHEKCNLTAYRFFLELFRCTVGDNNITSAKFDDLSIPQGISLKGKAYAD